jgi:hypothetical protein
VIPLKPRYTYRGFPGSPLLCNIVVPPSDLQILLRGSVVAVRFHLNHHRFQDHHSFTARFSRVHILQLGPSAPDFGGAIASLLIHQPSTSQELAPSVADTHRSIAHPVSVGKDSSLDVVSSPHPVHESTEDNDFDTATLSSTDVTLDVGRPPSAQLVTELERQRKTQGGFFGRCACQMGSCLIVSLPFQRCNSVSCPFLDNCHVTLRVVYVPSV